jgi:hypothetical protein
LDEEGLIPNTSWDTEFARRLFGDLNRDVLRPPGDSKVIIFSDSDEQGGHVGRSLPTPMPRLLLLWSPWLQPPLPPMPVKILREGKMIIVMVLPLILK